MAAKDRRNLVRNSKSFNGIDFVEVANDSQTALRVHFLNSLPLKHTLDNPPVTITGGESMPTVTVNPINEDIAWTQSVDGTHLILNLSVTAPGDFSNYVLQINQVTLLPSGPAARIDPFFTSSTFSFKAGCPSDLDCQAAPAVCPEKPSNAPPIDYLAKDFLSFRQALLDFSALRYPEWQERSEADFGVMFLEALCALADDLSYTQDRVAAEAFLETATQRSSVVRLARLVDYWPSPALSASVVLQFDVAATATSLPDGVVVTALSPDGSMIPFETGATLANRLAAANPPTTPVSPAWNRGAILPYWFDDSRRCLPAGATQMYVRGHGFQFFPAQRLLIETIPATSADPPIRQIVRLADPKPFDELFDPLLDPSTDLPSSSPGAGPSASIQGTPVTLIYWRIEDALTSNRDLTRTTLAGNLIAATQALTQSVESFAIPSTSAQTDDTQPAIVRTGPNDTPSTPSLKYLYTLRSAPLAWLKPDDPTQLPQPEVVLSGIAPGGNPVPWQYVKWLLDAVNAQRAFTVEPARFSRIAGTFGASLRFDYDGDAGDTLRFGDDVFGAMPWAGTTFNVTYRVGRGSAGNVAADSIITVDPSHAAAKQVVHVTNPLPATGGADPESLDSIRWKAPEAFRAVPFRAVLPSDYQSVAQSLPWIQRAGSVFRWTGSWLTVFTTPDPKATDQVTPDQRLELIDLLSRYRMAGYESFVKDPEYVSIDLIVLVCAQPAAFQGSIEQAVLTALGTGPDGFFTHDNITFGQPLEKSTLGRVVQSISGVAGVLDIRFRFSGRTTEFASMGDTVTVGSNQILRCDNDPSLPGNGSLQVIVKGGK